MASCPPEANGLALPPSPRAVSAGRLVAHTDTCGALTSRAFRWFLAWSLAASSGRFLGKINGSCWPFTVPPGLSRGLWTSHAK